VLDPAKMFCNIFANVLAENIFKTFLEVVTGKNKTLKLFTTFLQMSYFHVTTV